MQPAQCQNCGYDLTGSGIRGACPECGGRFNRASGMGIRSNTEAYQRGERLVARARTIILAVLGLAVLACGGAIQRFRSSGHGIAVGACVASVFLLAAAVSFLYEKE